MRKNIYEVIVFNKMTKIWVNMNDLSPEEYCQIMTNIELADRAKDQQIVNSLRTLMKYFDEDKKKKYELMIDDYLQKQEKLYSYT